MYTDDTDDIEFMFYDALLPFFLKMPYSRVKYDLERMESQVNIKF